MRRFLITLFAAFVAVGFVVDDAEARRLGGGRSLGQQREMPAKREAAPQRNQTPPAGNAAPQTPGRSWMGPIAGLAAGLGLAALFSHLGLGEEMANVLLIALLAMAAFAAFRWLARRGTAAAAGPAYAAQGAAAAAPAPARFEPLGERQGTAVPPQAPRTDVAGQAVRPGSVLDELGATPLHGRGHLPPGFDAEAFERQAKVNFIRLQAANDAGDLEDIRTFTTPEMYAEIKVDIDARRGASQKTEVVSLDAEVLEAVEEGNKAWVSVRFHGVIREDGAEAAPFDEIWHLMRPANGKHGWLVAGIQQNA
jgi:predicted lipid-binding transport protein (Tim44 family)